MHLYFPATICGLYLMFGVACTFFGYRCFKAVMFFTGFVFASIVVYLARTRIGFGYTHTYMDCLKICSNTCGDYENTQICNLESGWDII